MIQLQSNVRVADNSGARKAQCIKVLKRPKRRVSRVGGHIVVSVKKAVYKKNGVKEHEVHRGTVVRTKKKFRRNDGSFIKFDDNSIVILDEQDRPKGRTFVGAMAEEAPKKFPHMRTGISGGLWV